jgi:hypothetical protein
LADIIFENIFISKYLMDMLIYYVLRNIMKKVIFIVCLSLATVGYANFAKINSNTVSFVPLPQPVVQMKITNTKPVILSTMQIEVKIVGNIATSTYELSFYNPNNRVLSGQLKFGLLDGASVIDYALQINGKYRYASIVPKALATEAYENTIRQKIDPALLEQTVGNNFKVNLYPIPKNGYKKIKITTQELLKSKDNKLIYQMPFNTSTKLKNLLSFFNNFHFL